MSSGRDAVSGAPVDRVQVMNRAAEIQRQITQLSAELVIELEGQSAPPPASGREPAWLSIDDFAARLDVSSKTIRRMMGDGMPYERVRRRKVRIPVAPAERWITAAAERAAHLDGPASSVR
jgi:excisionase family DNA binding protein